MTWFDEYLKRYQNSIYKENMIDKLQIIKSLWESARKKNKKVIFAGNGGSAALSSHCSVDLTKNARVRAVNFNESDLIWSFILVLSLFELATKNEYNFP